jgi:hypothetical protein
VQTVSRGIPGNPNPVADSFEIAYMGDDFDLSCFQVGMAFAPSNAAGGQGGSTLALRPGGCGAVQVWRSPIEGKGPLLNPAEIYDDDQST